MADAAIAAGQIEKLRTKLLDLTTKNRLLNFTHGRANCLRFVDERPDQLFELLTSGSRIELAPVPEPSPDDLRRNRAGREPARDTDGNTRPSADRWAARLGIDTDYELPAQTDEARAGHRDKRIQCVLYRDQLDARARKLRSEARTAVEESGANMLYLAFGFLQWQETKGGDVHHLAPLLLVPVDIERRVNKRGAVVYDIGWTREDLQPNLSLRRKLEQDFGLHLPDLNPEGEPDDAASPEAYFRRVQSLVSEQPGWAVRRFATLALFNFGKVLLYLDLDAKRWPRNASPGETDVIRHLLSGAVSSTTAMPDVTAPAVAARIDLDLELVDRADSSQASALLRALGGETMLIEGPPGTGKSQTITNLIAAALGKGQTVLFVSEKLAALEVVRRRLEGVGLGAFCLELHSHKTRKRALLDDVEAALRQREQRRSSPGFDDRLAELRRARAGLDACGDLLTRCYGALDLQLHEVLAAAVQHRLQAEALGVPSAGEPDFDPRLVTAQAQRDAHHLLPAIGDAMRNLRCDGPIRMHPWNGVGLTGALPGDAARIGHLLRLWRDSTEVLRSAHAALAEMLGGSLPGHDLDDTRELGEAGARLAMLRAVLPDVKAAAIALDRIAAAGLGLAAPTGRGLRAAEALLGLAAAAPLEALGHRTPGLLSTSAIVHLSAYQDAVSRLVAREAEAAAVFKPGALFEDTSDLRRHAAELRSGGWFAWFRRGYRDATARYRALTGDPRRCPSRDMASRLERLAEAAEMRAALDGHPARAVFGTVLRGAQTDFQALKRLNLWAVEIMDRTAALGSVESARTIFMLSADELHALGSLAGDAVFRVAAMIEAGREEASAPSRDSTRQRLWSALCRIHLPRPLAGVAERDAGAGDLQSLEEKLGSVAAALAAYRQAKTAFRERAALDPEMWFGDTRPTLERIVERADHALSNQNGLSAWLDYLPFRAQATAPGVRSVVARAEAGEIPVPRLDLAYDLLLFESLARCAFADHPALATSGRATMDGLRRAYRELDEEVMELRQAAISHRLARRPVPQGMGGAPRDATDLMLLRREIKKQARHLPVRQLVQRAGRALLGLKPCFMMGPLSVAQYLPPGEIAFDLVIMDEASQIRPEDAIGALARARQVIIVGDTRQLPPTDFFNRIGADGDDDDGDGAATDAQSIMELAGANLPQPAELKLHYRSRHESLIAFSNWAFYDNELVVFPSPHGTNGELGVHFRHIPDAEFEGGLNVVEARTVAAAAVAHLRADPHRSIGVVAMNLKQAQRIEAEIDVLIQADPGVLRRIEDSIGTVEPFFVKNLENVQGDERDVIMLSMTYGPVQRGGRVPQRFGPINQELGWRRLNVLFTRARRRMVVFASMRASDIAPGDTPRRGVTALRDFLDYAETGRLGAAPRRTGRPPDSDFERAVSAALERHGYRCIAQLGVAGYFIDIAVEDPDRPGAYILAIECDGAAFHGSRSARDRDRLRQDILEGLGWEVVRIWSTDWFSNPGREVTRICERLEGLRAARRAPPATLDAAKAPPPIVEVALVSSPPGEVEGTPIAAPEKQPSAAAGRLFTIEDARDALIRLRETELRPTFPASDPARGLLRKSMIDALLRHRPTTDAEFRSSIPLELRDKTDIEQFRSYAPRVFEILTELS